MANFLSSLTGQQINDVMTKIEQGVPEGYAVGEKNGVPVSSSSVYYHNNAKYYAENAQASAARAEAAVPPSTAGAVFFDRSQSLTDAQKGQARANIGANGTNPNLLDNWWFGKGVINQRGVTNGTISSSTYLIDRWQCSRGAYSFTNDGMSFALSSGTNAVMHQYTGRTDLTNKTVTISVKVNGNIYSKTGIVNSATDLWQTDYVEGSVQFRLHYVDSTQGYQFLIYNYSSTPVIFQAVKLELGSVSTLANDAAPNIALELAKCQRYFIRYFAAAASNIAFGSSTSNGTSFSVVMPIVPMRDTPSVTYSGTIQVNQSGTNHTVTSITVQALVNNLIGLTFVSSNLSTNALGRVTLSANGYIDFSADL